MRHRDSASSTKSGAVPKRKSPSPAYWLLAIVLPAIFLAIMQAVDAPPTGLADWQHESAQFAAVAGETPPELTAVEWLPVSLPRRYLLERDGNGVAWYRLTFEVESVRAGPWAIYQRRPRANLAMFVNGMAVTSRGETQRPYSHDWSPKLIPLPVALLRTGTNELMVRTAAEPPTSQMDVTYIGPYTTLAAAYARHLLLDVTAKQATLAAMLLFAALFGIIYALRRRDTVFAAYGITILVWSLHVCFLLGPARWLVTEAQWHVLGEFTLVAFVVCSLMTVHRFLGRRPRRAERWLLAGATAYLLTALAAVTFLDGEPLREFNRYVGIPILLILSARAVLQLARAALANATIERRLMLLCALIVWVTGVRDFLVHTGAPGDGAHVMYLPYTVSFVLLVFGSLIMFRFARALRETEVLNRELEARVEQKAAELEANYARIRVFERKQALAGERSRIMRDMHDGIGGQLVAAIALASRPNASRELDGLLHEALDDLRMMIDSLESTEADLLTALGMLRMRVTNRFAAAGIEFHWEVTDIPPIAGFGPEQVLQLMRIVQEAFTNILKHARARTITVRTTTAQLASGEPAIAVEIEDDGAGLQPGRPAGRGLANMRRRAAALAAEIEVGSAAGGGTRVVVRLPLAGDSQARDTDHTRVARV